VQYGYRIEQLKAQKATMEEWNHQLRLEHASLADPQRIDLLARKELGLASPTPAQVIRVGSEGEPRSSVLARNMPAPVGGQGSLARGQ
jgi:Cell division protein FtsL